MEAPETTWWRKVSGPRFRGVALDVVVVLLAVGLGLSGASLGVSRALDVGPLQLSSRIAFGWPGETVVRVPPFGQASARTHAGPANLIITVEGVDVPEVERYIAESPVRTEPVAASMQAQAEQAGETVSDLISQETRGATREIQLLVLLATLVATGFAALVVAAFRRGWRAMAVACVLTASLLLGSGVVAAATFDPAALSQPRLQGALAYVPRLQSVFGTRLSRVERLRVQVADVANKLAAYYADPRSISAGGGFAGTYRVLHVTDLHLDPVGAELARSLARSYDASLVVDTGDIAISGAAQETALLSSLVVTSAPGVYVPGNHDSPAVNAAIDALPGITLAELGVHSVDGMRVFSVPDPVARGFGVEPDPELLERETARALARFEAQQRAGLPRPDIIAIHNPAMERAFVGLAPVILTGHTHSPRLYQEQGTVRINSGTLGGMPYDPDATGRSRLPHSASILYYTPQIPRQLIAVDRISVGVDGTTTLDRTIIDESLVP